MEDTLRLQIKFCADKLLDIFSLNSAQFGFCDSDGRNAFTGKKGVALTVALFLNRVVVPVVAIGFKRNRKCRQKEINSFPANHMLLLKDYLQILKGASDFLFKGSLAQVQAGALVRAKAGVVFTVMVSLKTFAASFTAKSNAPLSGGMLARLGAIFFIFGFGARLKGFFAIVANEIVKWALIPVPHAPLAAKAALVNSAVTNLKVPAAIITVPKNVWLASRDAVAFLRAMFLIRPSHFKALVARRADSNRPNLLSKSLSGSGALHLHGASVSAVSAKSAVFGLDKVAAMGAGAGRKFRSHMNLLSKIDLSSFGGARSLGCACQRVINPLKPYSYFTTSGAAEGAY